MAVLPLLLGCATVDAPPRERTRVEVDNQQWSDATVYFYCGATQRAVVRVNAATSTSRMLRLLPCDSGIHARVRFLASREIRVSAAEPAEFLRGGRVALTIPNNVDVLYLALYPER